MGGDMKFISVLLVVSVACFAEISATSETAPPDQTDCHSAQTEESFETPELILQPLSNEIDQNQPNGPSNMALFSQTNLAQTFQQTNDNISGAGILLQAGVGTSGSVTIQLWDNLPNAGGTMLAEASAQGFAGSWVDVFWTTIDIVPSNTYYLVFTGNTTLGISGDTSNPYANGCVFANGGYVPYTGFDFAFRTYYDTDVHIQRNTWASVKVFFN